MLPASPIAKVSMAVDPASDRVRQIVVPVSRFIEILSARLGRAKIRWSSSCPWAPEAAAPQLPGW